MLHKSCFTIMLYGHQRILKDFIKLADNGKLNHGYIFYGPPRIGKKFVALELANHFEGLDKIESKNKPQVLNDALVIETREAENSIGIDKIRKIREFFSQKPNVSRYRTVIVDSAELLTNEAQNALLKIAEEPPQSALLILISKDGESISSTIRSRLQKIYFSPLSKQEMAKWLKESGLAQKDIDLWIEKSLGEPGLVSASINDEKFKLQKKSAEQFLKSSIQVKGFIRDLVKNENFNLNDFLDALILLMSQARKEIKHSNIWHQVFELRRQSDYYNLNPRLQLENLAQQLEN